MNAPDQVVSEWITAPAGHLGIFDDFMTLMASDFFLSVTLSLYMLFLWFGTRDPMDRVQKQYGAMCASASLGFGNLGVHMFNRVIGFDPWPRPFMVHDNAEHAAQAIFYFPHDPSFPANGAAAFFAAAVGMWFYHRRASIPLFVIAIAWSTARVYAGVHYPLDILGGFAIGTCMALFTLGLMKLFWPLPEFCFWVARKLYVA